MTSKAAVDSFMAQRTLAVVGVSRGGKKFGNLARADVRSTGAVDSRTAFPGRARRRPFRSDSPRCMGPRGRRRYGR